jgi:hypothetical protein
MPHMKCQYQIHSELQIVIFIPGEFTLQMVMEFGIMTFISLCNNFDVMYHLVIIPYPIPGGKGEDDVAEQLKPVLIILRTDTGFSWPHFVLTSSVSSP